MKNPQILLLSFLFTLFSHAYAQEGSKRTCRILFVERPADAPKSLHLFDGKTSQEVELPSMNLSQLYPLASGAIQLKLLPAKVENSAPPAPDAPSVDVPENFTDFLLLVTSDPENKIAPVKLEAINLKTETFKLGQTLWINHTDITIKAELGTQTLSLDPQSSKIIDTPFGDKTSPTSGYFKASFTYQTQADGAFAPITEQQWWYDTNSRHLGFIRNSGGKLPKIYFFRDFRDPEAVANDPK